MSETRFDRNTLGATLVRADELRLTDLVVFPSDFGDSPYVLPVFSLELQGDDVEINGDFTTSQGNTFFVLGRDLP